MKRKGTCSGWNAGGICGILVAFAVTLSAAFLPGLPAHASGTGCYGVVDKSAGQAVLYIPGTVTDSASAIIGTDAVTDISCAPVSDLPVPCETYVLLDNSLSMSEELRPGITEFLKDLAADHMEGEAYTIATFSDTLTYQCRDETSPDAVDGVIDAITYQKQKTQLIDCLYQLLEDIEEKGSLNLKRIVLVTDGTEHNGIGYTSEELENKVRELGIPIYSIGCLSADSNEDADQDLENLFAIARLTDGGTVQLQKEADVNTAVSLIQTWNDSTQVTVPIPAKLCDGMEHRILVTGGDVSASAALTMPQIAMKTDAADAADTETTQEEEAKAVNTEVSVAESTEEEGEEMKLPIKLPLHMEGISDTTLLICIGAGVVVIVLVIVLVLVSGKSRQGTKKTKKGKAVPKKNTVQSPFGSVPGNSAVQRPVQPMQQMPMQQTPKPYAAREDATRMMFEGTQMMEQGTQMMDEGTQLMDGNGPAGFGVNPGQASPAGLMLVLVNVNDPSLQLSGRVTGETRIGRQANLNDIVTPVSMNTISRRQCVVRYHDGALWISNVSDHNTTWLNGEQVGGEMMMQSGATLELGAAREKFSVSIY
jgi:Na+-transporting methylmalonyl-CoA/oxaloacetate decarboxylase gamma subunit